MTLETQNHQSEWWNDQEQMERLEQRMSASPLSRRSVLGFLGAVAAGAAAAACGSSDSKSSTPSASSSGTTAAGTTAAGATTGTAGEKLAKTQTLRHTVTDEPATFDYNFNLYAQAYQTVAAGLLKFDENFNAVPDMAESFTVNDKGDVYTFKMRRNSKWSNGDPATARDFEYSWKRRLDPTSGADYAAFLYDIKNGEAFNSKKITDASQLGVKATDDYTLEVTLEAPAGYFPVLTAYVAAVPTHRASVEKFGDKYGSDADKFVANGPFKLTKWDHNKSFELSKNENYWNAANVKLDKVTFAIIKQDQRASAYENNEIDYMPRGNPGDYKRLSGDSKISKELYKFDPVGSWYLMPNPKFEPFNDVKVRQAMAHAVDRDKIARDIHGGLATPAFTQVNPVLPQYDPNKYDQYTKFDPKLAMDTLKGTKYEGGKNWPKITMSMRNNESDADKATQQALAQMFKDALGMTVELEQGDPQVVYKEMRQGTKQLMWLRWYMDYPDARNDFYDCFYSKIPVGSRRSWWENADFDNLVVQASSEKDQEKRKQLYYKANDILLQEAAAIFVYYPLFYGARKSYVKGTPKNKAGQEVPDWNIFLREHEFLYITEH